MLEKHVLEFLKILHMTQTNIFHQWNVESIKRSYEWALMIEKMYPSWIATHDPIAQEKYFKYVQFPINQSVGKKKSKAFSIDALKFGKYSRSLIEHKRYTQIKVYAVCRLLL
jgi:hypothetical protein